MADDGLGDAAGDVVTGVIRRLLRMPVSLLAALITPLGSSLDVVGASERVKSGGVGVSNPPATAGSNTGGGISEPIWPVRVRLLCIFLR